MGRNKRLGEVLLLAVVALVLAQGAWGAPQSDQDPGKKVTEQLRKQRLKSAQVVDGDEDAMEPADQDHAWLLNREVFHKLSSGGQRAVLFLQGKLGEGRGRHGREGHRGKFGQNLRVNNPALDEFGVTQSESSIAASGRNIVVAFNDLGGFNTVSGYAFSTDNGRTFTHRRLEPVPDGLNRGDPVVAYGPDGELYYSNISRDAQRRSFIGVAKSLDNGDTFSLPVNASTTATNSTDFHDKPWMTVDTCAGSPFRGNVYVSWTDFTPGGSFIAFARSTDIGQTFSAPIHITPLSNIVTMQGSMPVVAPSGDVYVAFWEIEASRIHAVKSTDGGQSFSAPVTAAQFLGIFPKLLTGGGGMRMNSFPSMALDDKGNVHIVFNAEPGLFGLDRSDIFYVRSEDGGSTFTAPVRLNDDATNTSQFFPSVAVTEEGALGVKWWDRRNDPTHDSLTDVYMTISMDGGRTFSPNFRATDHNWAFGPVPGGQGSSYHGDYDAMTGGRNRLLLSWSDERGSDPDVYFSEEQAEREHDTPDFNVSVEKLFDLVIAGRAAEFTLSTQGFHGFSGNLHLRAEPAITGITYRFSPVTLKPGESASLVIQTHATTAPGTYLISVAAAGRGMERRTNLRLTVYPPDRLAGVPVNATNTPGFTRDVAFFLVSSGSVLQADSSGVVHLAYDDDTLIPSGGGNQIFYKQSRDDGTTFSTPLLLSTNSPISFEPSLALDSRGNPYVVWGGVNASFTAVQIFLSRSADGGATFSAPIAITPAAHDAGFASIAVDNSGKILVTYQNFATASLQLFAVRSTNGGASFSVPVAISPGSDRLNSISPAHVAFDSLGVAYVVYNSIVGTPRVRLAIAADGANFTVLKTVSSPLVAAAFAPHITVDNHGNLHITFHNRFVSPSGFNREVMLIRSMDHGATFSAQLNVSNNTGQSAFPFVIADTLGNMTLAWEDTTDNDQSDIFVAHSTDGGVTFGASFNLSGNSGVSKRACGAANALGKLFVCWTDDSPANTDVFVAAIPF